MEYIRHREVIDIVEKNPKYLDKFSDGINDYRYTYRVYRGGSIGGCFIDIYYDKGKMEKKFIINRGYKVDKYAYNFKKNMNNRKKYVNNRK